MFAIEDEKGKGKEKKKKKRKKNKMFFKIKIAIRSDTHVIKRVSILPSMTIPITVHIYDQLDDVSHIIPLRKSLTKKKKLDVTVLSKCIIRIFKFLNSS